MMPSIDQSNPEPEKTERVIRRRGSRKKPVQVAIQEPPIPAPHGYHPRPAKSALRGVNMAYEPPYESAAMPIGQRAEHPEYDTGKPVASPLELLLEDEAA